MLIVVFFTLSSISQVWGLVSAAVHAAMENIL